MFVFKSQKKKKKEPTWKIRENSFNKMLINGAKWWVCGVSLYCYTLFYIYVFENVYTSMLFFKKCIF